MPEKLLLVEMNFPRLKLPSSKVTRNEVWQIYLRQLSTAKLLSLWNEIPVHSNQVVPVSYREGGSRLHGMAMKRFCLNF